LRGLYNIFYPQHWRLGSIANYQSSVIPEAELAVKIVKEWIRDLFYTLNPVHHSLMFLSSMTQGAFLAFAFDKQVAQDYLRRAPSVIGRRPKELMRGRQGEHYIIHDLLESIDGTRDCTISAGILFIQAVCDKGLRIDVGVLCHLIEYICASFAIAYKFRWSSSLHDLTLPRSWLVALSRDDSLRNRQTHLIPLLLESMEQLLESIYSGTGNLDYNAQTLEKVPFRLLNIFIARICRALCLLGYNISDLKTRLNIVRIITSLQRPSRTFPSLYANFVNAKTWDNLVMALRKSSEKFASPLDELIQLKEESKVTGPSLKLTGTRTIIYKNSREISALLGGPASSGSILRPDAVPFVPRVLQKPVEGDVLGEDDMVDEDIGQSAAAAEVVDGGIDHAIDLEAAAMSVDAGRTQLTAVAPTDEEREAATTLQKKYRALLSGRKIRQSASSEANSRWFTACMAVAPKLHNTAYRVRFLGPLSYALVCLEVANIHAFEARKRAAKEIRKTKHQELEEALKRQDKALRLCKEVLRLQKVLTPKSDFHLRECKKELRETVEEVQQLILSLPLPITKQCQSDLDVAVKGIVRKRALPAKEPKPELNVEDNIMDM